MNKELHFELDYQVSVFSIFGKKLSKHFKSKKIELNDVCKEMSINRMTLASIFKGRHIFDEFFLNKLLLLYPDIDSYEIEKFFEGDSQLFINIKKTVGIGEYVGHQIKQYRQKNNLSTLAFSKIIGIDNGYLSKLEEGKVENGISLNTIYRLCKVFNCTSTDILNF
jgi:transcriptional regulator with XRE-family HTH domain